MKKKSDIEKARSGLRLALGIIAAMLTMSLLVYGFQKLRFPNADDGLRVFLKAYPPRVVGLISILLAMAVSWATMNMWAKFLPGLFGYAGFGGSLAIVSGGWQSTVPGLRLTRLEVAAETALYAICCLLTLRLGGARITLLDRLGVLAAASCFAYGVTSEYAAVGMKMLGVMAAIFLVMAAFDRFEARRKMQNAQ